MTKPASTVGHALQHARNLGLDPLDAQLLLLHTLEKPADQRAWLAAHGDEALALEAAAWFLACVKRRLADEPLAYIVGHREFYGLTLKVDRRVLIPRPDTETLVDWSLELLRDRPGAKLIDLGTGSGAIALALKHQRADLRVSALDASKGALDLARDNARLLGLNVEFVQGNWLEGIEAKFDLIASNPPYVRSGDPHLPALRDEPVQALVAGSDGLADLRQIIASAPACLSPGGWLLLEHGYNQAEAVRELLQNAGLRDVSSRRDLAGIERCSGGRLHALPLMDE